MTVCDCISLFYRTEQNYYYYFGLSKSENEITRITAEHKFIAAINIDLDENMENELKKTSSLCFYFSCFSQGFCLFALGIKENKNKVKA